MLIEQLKEACEKLDGLFEKNQCVLNVSGGRIIIELDGNDLNIRKELSVKSVRKVDVSQVKINDVDLIYLETIGIPPNELAIAFTSKNAFGYVSKKFKTADLTTPAHYQGKIKVFSDCGVSVVL